MSPVRSPGPHTVGRALAGLTLLLATPAARARQFVLFDVTFTFPKEDADNSEPSQSHYYVRGEAMNPDRPKDWTNPVDYRNGTVRVRAEVLEKPDGGAATAWSLCYIPYKGVKAGYGCTNTDVYREKCVFEKDVTMTAWLMERGKRLRTNPCPVGASGWFGHTLVVFGPAVPPVVTDGVDGHLSCSGSLGEDR